ncbi:MAG: wax ester/triacylglycerol synthase family O-acyltransferase [Pseudomonadota bacterium]
MQQLSGLDTSFLYLESTSTPMHIGSLAIYDQASAPGGRVTFKGILEFFESRMHLVKLFRQRLANVPLSVDKPFWVDDENFDLEYHIRHIALPHPGDWRQLCIQAARLHARPLDLNKPLWEITVIEGLDNVANVPKGAFALVSKFHHAAIDGVAGSEIAAAIHDLSPEPSHPPEPQSWEPGRQPTGLELIGRSALSSVQVPGRVGRLAASVAPSVRKIFSGVRGRQMTAPARAPRTRFNSNVGPHRVFDGRTFKLDDVRTIRKASDGATVNDVVVTTCGGALRKYLLAKDELPETSLVAMAPRSIRSSDQSGAGGNRVTAMSLPIRTDIADPLERLAAVSDESRAAKQFNDAAGRNLAPDLAELIPVPAGQMAARLYSSAKLAERLPPMFNTVITNVPGPAIPIFSMGSQMVRHYGLGPCVHGIGLFQPVLSYNGEITISAVACREMMPDPAFYSDCLKEAFEELLEASKRLKPEESPPKAKSRRRKTNGSANAEA